MANEQNLRPVRNKKEARELGKKGGVASGIARRQKKTLSELGDMIGNLSIKSEQTRDKLREAGISDDDMISDVLSLFELSKKANKGDPKAIELLAKLRGQLKTEEPLANINIQSVNISFGNKKVIEGEEAK